MSALSDFLTQPSFWWGGLAGTAITGVIAPLITARSVRASDLRRATQEERIDSIKAARDELRSNRQILTESANEFSAVCSAVMEKAIDAKGVFNTVMDAVQNMEGRIDKKALEKVEYAVDLMDEAKRITTAFNHLRVVAPVPVLKAASELNAAVLALTQATTVPLAKPPLMASAGKAMEDFTNAVRAELGLDPYTAEIAGAARKTYMESLTKQMNDYIRETQEEARRFGFLEPGAVPITAIRAGDLTEQHVGKFVGFHDPGSGLNYGAKILEIVRVEGSRPGILLRIGHPPIPGGQQAHQERLRLGFEQDIQLVELPDFQPNDSNE